MQVSELLRRKGSGVATVDPGASVTAVLSMLAELGIGALVVSGDGVKVEGIVSERDIVRRLARDGIIALELLARDVMTERVVTCGPETGVDELMTIMTEGRFRHVPVTELDLLIGIISIGDVVNARVRELEEETRHLTSYISGY
ncbi:MAG: CBS domain-containing protein [Actinomycetota bacterium]